MNDPLRAFIDHEEAQLSGRADGPLSGLRFAVKDLFDIAGHITGCGSPDWLETHGPAQATSPVVTRLLEAGADMVGKTHTDELAYSLFGENFHYGTPVNPKAPDRVPGGSSSGSASAVAGRLVDFAVGSDTGGSVRVPASFCGVLGIRPTHGRIPLDHCWPMSPSFDTAGWFANDPEIFERVGEVLLGEPAHSGRPGGFLIADDAFGLLDPPAREAADAALEDLKRALGEPERIELAGQLETWRTAFVTLGAAQIWKLHGDWITSTRPNFGPLIKERFEATSRITPDQVEAMEDIRKQATETMGSLLSGGKVLIWPTAPGPAPFLNTPPEHVESFRFRTLRLTCPAGLARLPQVNLPLTEAEGAPLGISIISARGNDMMLLGLAKAILQSRS